MERCHNLIEMYWVRPIEILGWLVFSGHFVSILFGGYVDIVERAMEDVGRDDGSGFMQGSSILLSFGFDDGSSYTGCRRSGNQNKH